mmetsp:Transcript_40091/g.70574  ORF Transcript_40091/g.70574 Transcript_40091/m.70574 type:complete len:200 (-) Transcript_40091:602-1201(-)
MFSQTPRCEVLHHLQSDLRLIHGYHVSSIEDLHEAEAIACPQLRHSPPIELVIVVGCSIEIVLVRPCQFLCPFHVSKPITDVIHVASVDERLDAVSQHVGEELLVVDHPISSCHKKQVYSNVARAPPLCHSKLLLHLLRVQVFPDHVEIVAEPPVLARDSHIVGVLTCQLIRNLRHQVAQVIRSETCCGVEDTPCLRIL